MLVLDTNHFSEFRRGTPPAVRLRERLRLCDEDSALTVVTAEEVMRGWLAELQRHREEHRIIEGYRRLSESIEDLAEWTLLPWTEETTARFRSLRAGRVRIGTQDLRIACIALAHDATLLTRNLADFRQVPGLRVENWLD